MGIFQLIGSILKVFLFVWKVSREKDEKIKVKKEEALKEITNGIKKRDASAINNAFARINRM